MWGPTLGPLSWWLHFILVLSTDLAHPLWDLSFHIPFPLFIFFVFSLGFLWLWWWLFFIYYGSFRFRRLVPAWRGAGAIRIRSEAPIAPFLFTIVIHSSVNSFAYFKRWLKYESISFRSRSIGGSPDLQTPVQFQSIKWNEMNGPLIQTGAFVVSQCWRGWFPQFSTLYNDDSLSALSALIDRAGHL